MSAAVLRDGKSRIEVNPNDPRLLRAARRLIRLYEGEQAGPFWLKAESIAKVIAEELNHPGEES